MMMLTMVLVTVLGSVALLYHLSQVHIILFEVVLLTMVSIVVPYLFLFSLLFLVLTGLMALFCYFASYYARRGCCSNNEEYCGIFSNSFNAPNTYTGWSFGTALSYFILY